MSAKRATGEDFSQPTRESPRDTEIEHVAAALRGLQYGVVTVIVQDGVVVQIERTEKTRLRGKQQS